MRIREWLTLVITLSVISIPVRADEHSEHAHFGDMGQVGIVHFPTSCSPQVQPQFERAVAMLHSFWYPEAEKSFQVIAQADSQCSMAWWGVAMSLWHPLWPETPTAESLERGLAAVHQAQAVTRNTARERDYIAAIGAFYENHDKADHHARALAYEKAMEKVAQRYPDDREASIFYALALLTTASPTDKTYANQKKASEILEKIIAAQPDHPGVTHYLIHSYDNPALASQGLIVARRYAEIAPSVPHAQHMPSHIFVRLGLWQEAIASNLASAAAARDYEVKSHMHGAWQERLHALDYLAYSYLQTGRDIDARRVVEEAAGVTRINPANFIGEYALAAIPARFTIERQDWTGTAMLKPRSSAGPAAEAITWWARVLGAARQGNVKAAQEELAKIQLMKDKLEVSPEANAKYWAGQVEIQRSTAAAWLAHAQGQNEEAVRLMRSAADMEDSTEKSPVTPGPVVPARELLADLLLEMKRPAPALAEFETSLKSSPNRLHAIYGAAQAAEAAKQAEVARRYYAKVVESCAKCSTDEPRLRQAQQFLARD